MNSFWNRRKTEYLSFNNFDTYLPIQEKDWIKTPSYHYYILHETNVEEKPLFSYFGINKLKEQYKSDSR